MANKTNNGKEKGKMKKWNTEKCEQNQMYNLYDWGRKARSSPLQTLLFPSLCRAMDTRLLSFLYDTIDSERISK